MPTKKEMYSLGAILLFGFLLHLPQISLDIQGIHTWRQSQTMWNIRNFHRHDANILNPKVSSFNDNNQNIYRYEFPIMQWTIAHIEHLFGEHISTVRISMYLIGAIGLIGFYFLISFLFKSYLIGLLSTWSLLFSPLIYYFIINPLPDLLALSAIIWYIYFILKHNRDGKRKDLIYASICLLVSTWAKLPFLMFSIISIYLFIKMTWKDMAIKWSSIKYGLLQFLIITPALVWYAWVIPSWSNGVLSGVFQNTIDWSTTLNIAGYHIDTMFPQILLSPITLILFII